MIGVIEGFYGRPWSWEARADYAEFLSREGFSFYIYAPKGDRFLRKGWREPFPPEHAETLRALAVRLRASGLSFGIGLSPFEAYRSFDEGVKTSLRARLSLFEAVGAEWVAVLFDDMKGDAPRLAEVQADMLHWIRDHSKAKRLLMCPTYYSLDPVLDRIFGRRPPDYLGRLGKALDPSIDVFWTGEKICSPAYEAEHLRATGALLRRKPFVWDNYPVNDGPRMCKFLHLRARAGEPPEAAGLAANPMNQPELSKIPLRTLAGRPWASPIERLASDLALFQDQGLEGMPEARKAELIAVYEEIDHPAAREVVDWLQGAYAVESFSS